MERGRDRLIYTLMGQSVRRLPSMAGSMTRGQEDLAAQPPADIHTLRGEVHSNRQASSSLFWQITGAWLGRHWASCLGHAHRVVRASRAGQATCHEEFQSLTAAFFRQGQLLLPGISQRISMHYSAPRVSRDSRDQANRMDWMCKVSPLLLTSRGMRKKVALFFFSLLVVMLKVDVLGLWRRSCGHCPVLS